MNSGRLVGSQRFFELPTIPIIVICVAAWLSSFLFATDSILTSPYFGAVFTANGGEPGIVVGVARPGSPAARGDLTKGAVINAIGAANSNVRFELSEVSGVHERSEIGSYEAWTKLGRERPELWRLITSGGVAMDLQDGRTVNVSPDKGRSWSSLPAGFWIGSLHSFGVLLISVGILVFASPSPLIRLLFLCGLCLSANIFSHAIRASEELVSSPGLSDMLYLTSNLSAVMFTYSLLAVLWHTPRPLIRFPFAGLAIGFAFFVFVTQHFQWFAFPIHPFQFPYLLAIVLALALTAFKWVASRGKPVDRATLSWVLLSIFAAVLPWLVVFSLPIVLGGQPLIDANLSGLILTITFIGFALGAFKYRLFGMQTIWWGSLVWLSTGIVILLIDLFLLAALHWTPQQALITSALLASWGYFPIRNFIYNRLANRNEVSVETATRTMFQQLASIPDLAEFDGRFIGFLKTTFRAKDVGITPGGRVPDAAGGDGPHINRRTAIRDDGLSLAVPTVGTSDKTYILSGRNMGLSLFSLEDKKMADILLELAHGIYTQKAKEFEKREFDRTQIVRDLHDDVGAKLLSLIYAAPEKSRIREIAEQALKALKDSLMTIEDFEDLDLETGWSEMWREQNERLTEAGFETRFQIDFEGSRIIGARDLVNMKRILEEHVSNILKYADKSDPVDGFVHLHPNGDLVVQLRNSRKSEKAPSQVGGRGLANMIARARESAAEIRLGDDESGSDRFCFRFRLPLTA